nr:hypothetical protein [Tanacetum cinerariifolium]
MHEDFIAIVYPQVHESLKHLNKEHVHSENPLSSSRTLLSMKNLDDAFTYATIATTITTLPPPPPPQQQSTIDSILAARVTALEHICANFEKKNKTLEPDWVIHPNDLPKPEKNRADAISKSYKDPKEDKLLQKTRDMDSFIKWYCRQIGNSKLSKANSKGLSFKIDLTKPEGNRVVLDVRKPLPLGGPPCHVTIQTQYFFNNYLEYLVSSEKERRGDLSISKLKGVYYQDFGLKELVSSLWIESERYYEISAAYDISYWWFKRKEFYITRHCVPSDHREVISHMKILSVVSLKTFSRYGYTYLKEIVLRRADYQDYKISKADFKNMLPNDFEDMCLLHLQGKLNHLSGSEKVALFNATKLNLTQLNWDESDFLFKEDYTIVSKLRAVIYSDRNNQKQMMMENKVHKFSDGTLTRILEKLDHMVKDLRLFKYNMGMENRIWYEDDKWRSEEFIE